MRTALFFLSILCISFIHSEEKPSILVSVSAYTEIVQELSGDLASVHCLIPASVNFHSYEPRPKDSERALHCSLWFSLMDPFEDKFAQALASHNAPIKRVDLQERLPHIQSCCHTGIDPHIWLDPHLMLIQLNTIAEALQQQFPAHRSEIEQRLNTLKTKMTLLINQVDVLLKPTKGKTVVVAHAAYGHLCKRYGIEQLSLEQEGKEPSLVSFSRLIQKAEHFHVKTVFSLKQYPKNGIEKAAEILGARIVDLDPYSEKYFDNIVFTAQSFREAMDEESSDPTL